MITTKSKKGRRIALSVLAVSVVLLLVAYPAIHREVWIRWELRNLEDPSYLTSVIGSHEVLAGDSITGHALRRYLETDEGAESLVVLCLRSQYSKLDQLTSEYSELAFLRKESGAVLLSGVKLGGERIDALVLCGRLFASAQDHLLTVQGRDIYPSEIPHVKVRVDEAQGIPRIVVRKIESSPRDR